MAVSKLSRDTSGGIAEYLRRWRQQTQHADPVRRAVAFKAIDALLDLQNVVEEWEALDEPAEVKAS